MAGFTTDEKVNLLFKKLLGKPSTKHNNPYFQEPSKISNTNINVRPSVIVSKQLYLDNIPDTVPVELLNTLVDNLGNPIEGSIIGKSSDNNIIKKYVKIPFEFIPGSAIGVSPHSAISFYLPELQNAIPFNYDPVGSYLYELYENDGTTVINYGQGDWVIDPEGGILTFYDNIPNVSESLPPKISFYKYNGTIGLYPITITENKDLVIEGNLMITKNITVNNDLNIDNELILKKGCIFNNVNLESFQNNITGTIRFADNLLKTYVTDKWKTIAFKEDLEFITSVSSPEEEIIATVMTGNVVLQDLVIYQTKSVLNPLDGYILNENDFNTLIRFDTDLQNDITLILPDSTLNIGGIMKHILIHKSFDYYHNNFKVNIKLLNALDPDGNGIDQYTINLKSSGQHIELMWIWTSGYDLKYWQILRGAFD